MSTKEIINARIIIKNKEIEFVKVLVKFNQIRDNIF